MLPGARVLRCSACSVSAGRPQGDSEGSRGTSDGLRETTLAAGLSIEVHDVADLLEASD